MRPACSSHLEISPESLSLHIAHLRVRPDVETGERYGPSGVEYAAADCSLLGDGQLSCATAPGLGEGLKFVVTVAGQASDEGGGLSYAAPALTGADPDPSRAGTEGGVVVVLTGANLGLGYPDAYVEVVFDGAVVPVDGAATTKASPGTPWAYACESSDCVAFVLPELADDRHEKGVSVRVGSRAHPSIVQQTASVAFEFDGPAIAAVSTADGDRGGLKIEIVGRNFGATAAAGRVYVQGARVPSSQISTYAHDHIVLTHLGSLAGALYVAVGDKDSEERPFQVKSPRVITDVASSLRPASTLTSRCTQRGALWREILVPDLRRSSRRDGELPVSQGIQTRNRPQSERERGRQRRNSGEGTCRTRRATRRRDSTPTGTREP